MTIQLSIDNVHVQEKSLVTINLMTDYAVVKQAFNLTQSVQMDVVKVSPASPFEGWATEKIC